MKTIIATHKNTDFDALASLAAAKLMYPDSRPCISKSINPNVKAFLSIHKDVFSWIENKPFSPDSVQRLLVVDTGAWERLGGINVHELRRRSDLEILLWDHHPQPLGIQPVWKCHHPTGANITLMLRCLRAESISPTPIQATLFLAGVYEDTGQLTFPGTTAEDAYAVAYFLEHGADLAILKRFLRPAYDEKQKSILFDMLKTARRTKINGYKLSISQLAVKGHVEGLALVVNMFRDIMNVDAAFGIFSLEHQQKCMVIGRGDSDGLNIGDIMRSLGGGGHPGAGSAMLRQANPDAVARMICELVEGNQQASVQIGDLMSFPVHTISPETSMASVAERLRKKGCTGFPVAQDGQLVGIISRRDFKKVRKNNQLKAPVKAFMQRQVHTIEAGKSPLQAARLMVRHDIGRLPVVKNGQMVGIVTRSDVMHYFYDLLPD